ncbi:ABC transporter permease [Rhizobium rhizogenes]|uniref:ABC transporter permease n=1 Tax=Rhizobium rhizogenes TaxID=359 RepID=UPI00191E4B48|nr:ABC transporter permease [Rhizobium rhizogenes]
MALIWFLTNEVNRYRKKIEETTGLSSHLAIRRAFNPNGTQSWFKSIVSLADQLSMLIIILTGAALLREREHGTIEHLLVMPLTAFEIALAKVWANGLVIIVAFACSLLFVVEGALHVPIAGLRGLLMLGTTIYVFAAAAIGIFLGTLARTMAQFALLMMMVVMPMMMLSGGYVTGPEPASMASVCDVVSAFPTLCQLHAGDRLPGSGFHHRMEGVRNRADDGDNVSRSEPAPF